MWEVVDDFALASQRFERGDYMTDKIFVNK